MDIFIWLTIIFSISIFFVGEVNNIPMNQYDIKRRILLSIIGGIIFGIIFGIPIITLVYLINNYYILFN